MRRFTRFVWLVLAYDVLVVLWGAYVRVSFSGDGCGSHWPLCNGELVPHATQTKTIVELSHRVSSGGSLVLAVVLFAWATRLASKGALVRRWSAWVLAFTASEALIGAALVLLRLVAHDLSLRRGISTSLHLTNTFLLLASLAVTARVSAGAPPLAFRGRGWLGALAFGALAAALVVGATGSIAALGDTLYPSHSVAQGLAQDLAPSAPLFIRLRSLHPFVAIGAGVLLLALATLAPVARPTPLVQRFSRALSIAYFVQLGLGALNIMMLAPTWLQLLHLLSADVVWVLLVLLATTALGEERVSASLLLGSQKQRS
jgi:heme A synthase